ncbi:MAG: hypothetical protein K2I87_07215 [Bacteroidales bacterium]|nr:hypothetical protein [Bacteroidales bacterium]
MKGYLLNTVLLISLLSVGCKPAQMIGGSTDRSHENEHIARQIDSVFIYKTDSVVIREKGDTLFIYQCRTEYRDRWRDRTDTVVVRDSIATDTPVVVYKTMTGWQNFQVWLGRIVLAIGLGFLILKLIKRNLKPF